MTVTEIHAQHTFSANCYVVQSREGNAFLFLVLPVRLKSDS